MPFNIASDLCFDIKLLDIDLARLRAVSYFSLQSYCT